MEKNFVRLPTNFLPQGNSRLNILHIYAILALSTPNMRPNMKPNIDLTPTHLWYEVPC